GTARNVRAGEDHRRPAPPPRCPVTTAEPPPCRPSTHDPNTARETTRGEPPRTPARTSVRFFKKARTLPTTPTAVVPAALHRSRGPHARQDKPPPPARSGCRPRRRDSADD